MKRDLFDTKDKAEKRASKLGCKGTHEHEDGFMPCSSHNVWEKTVKNTKRKSSKKDKGEIDEFIDYDGTMTNSKIPILDPHLHPKKTTDQTVAMTRITQDPLLRGFRVYYGESTMKEEDMSDAFGYEETQFMNAEDTIKYLEKELGLEPESAEMRADEFGLKPERDNKSEFKDEKGFAGRPILKEKTKVYTKKEVEEVIENLLSKKEDVDNIQPKEPKAMSDILVRNVKALRKLAEKEGISLSQLSKMIKSE
jgi:hypothetical protein